MRERSDDALWSAWSTGDGQAGVALVRRYYDSVFTFFANRLGLEEAAELTQDTFTSLVEARDRFACRSSVRTYIFAIARWKLVEHGRRCGSRQRRFAVPGTDESDQLDVQSTTLTSLSSWMDGRKQESLLVLALRSIPLDDQILLMLKGYEELTSRELSEVFEVAIGTISGRVRRARQRLEQVIRRLAADPRLADDTITGLDTYMRSIRVLSRVETPDTRPACGG